MRPRKKNRHLPSCIYPSHGAYYLVKNNKWERLGTDLAEVLEIYGRRMQSKKGSMPDLIDRAMAQVKVSKSSEKQYKAIAEKLKEIFKDAVPQQIDGASVAKVKAHYSGTPFYANRLLSVLRIVFNYAVEWQIVRKNPCIGITRHQEQKRTRYLNDQEFKAIREKSGERLKIIIDLCYLTGQRISDVLKIRRSDLVESGIAFRQQKTGATLIVGWSSDLRAVVERAKAMNTAVTLLANRKGKAPDYSTVKIQWDKARTEAGVPDARIHDLRAKALTDACRRFH